MAVIVPSNLFGTLDPVTTQFLVQNWPQTENSNVYEHSVWQRVSAPLRYGVMKGMLANVTDASQITRSQSASGTMTNDTTDPAAAPASVILGSPGSNSTSYFKAPTNAGTFDLSLGVNVLCLPVKITGTTNITALKMSVSSDAFVSGNYHTVPLAQNAAVGWHTDGRWSWMSFNANDMTLVGTGATLTAINSIRWELQAAGAQNALTLEIGPVFVRPVQATKAMCVISCDDGYDSGWSEVAKRMVAYGFPGVLFPKASVIGTGVISGNMAIREALALRDYHGWQIGTHTWATIDHNNYFNGDALAQYMNKQRLWQQAMGFQHDSDDFAWSGVVGSSGVHYQDQDHWDQVRKNFRTARTTYAKSASCESCPPADPWRLRCWLWGGDVWNGGSFATDPKMYIDRVIAAKGLAYFCIHNSVGAQGNPTDTTNFDTLLAYLDTNRSSIDVVTIATAVTRMNALA